MGHFANLIENIEFFLQKNVALANRFSWVRKKTFYILRFTSYLCGIVGVSFYYFYRVDDLIGNLVQNQNCARNCNS